MAVPSKNARKSAVNLGRPPLEDFMATEPIQEDFDVFVHDGDKAVGAVRQVSPH